MLGIKIAEFALWFKKERKKNEKKERMVMEEKKCEKLDKRRSFLWKNWFERLNIYKMIISQKAKLDLILV